MMHKEDASGLLHELVLADFILCLFAPRGSLLVRGTSVVNQQGVVIITSSPFAGSSSACYQAMSAWDHNHLIEHINPARVPAIPASFVSQIHPARSIRLAGPGLPLRRLAA
ncbi:uncharacterized protein [Aegilops tauschii subsp. strangulata]|uniref:uncharacterized protein isoform X4 n=1 Tax=Aegilops tauschii subsp. strangulata TaxID=200361 RepID=UPI003CC8A5C6